MKVVANGIHRLARGPWPTWRAAAGACCMRMRW
jgi:hypothetical protein